MHHVGFAVPKVNMGVCMPSWDLVEYSHHYKDKYFKGLETKHPAIDRCIFGDGDSVHGGRMVQVKISGVEPFVPKSSAMVLHLFHLLQHMLFNRTGPSVSFSHVLPQPTSIAALKWCVCPFVDFWLLPG